MKNPFATSKSLADKEAEDEELDIDLSIAQKRAMIRELQHRGQDWKNFSDNGKKSGISWSRIWNWLKAH